MTAEIAILNKTAVALAADSAVTISAGSKEEKIYDSAEKLFELCRHNHIGVMVYNNTSFVEAPMALVIHQFRAECKSFETVKIASEAFLRFLNNFGKRAKSQVKSRGLEQVLYPVMELISLRYGKKIDELLTQLTENVSRRKSFSADDWRKSSADILATTIADYQAVIQREDDCLFLGTKLSNLNITNKVIKEGIRHYFEHATDDNKKSIDALMRVVLGKKIFSKSATGVVIAGFGSREMFPTLISFEIDGIVDGQLRYAILNEVDIDRAGPKARVIPFAQKEMVERFLHGLDEDISDSIASFAQSTVSKVRAEIMGQLVFRDEADRAVILDSATKAENAFLDGLKREAFEAIRSRSQAEIEDMVEFMPKPELSKMAEALVNLTSIKRRVSRGMETVGGPIDVALISHSEGFVWVKRKRYFPSELNPRYFYRVKQALNQGQEVYDDEDETPRSPRRRGGKPKELSNIGEHGSRAEEGGDEDQ